MITRLHISEMFDSVPEIVQTMMERSRVRIKPVSKFWSKIIRICQGVLLLDVPE